MKFPLILRIDHDAQMGALLSVIEVERQLITARNELIVEKDHQISVLTEMLSAQRCNDYTPEAPKERKSASPVVTGRGGYRSKAEAASKLTFRKVGDSNADLQRKVESEGGK